MITIPWVGFVLSLIGEFPNRGTTVSYKNLDITIKRNKKAPYYQYHDSKKYHR